jgi:hypothetical protein
MWHCQQDNLSMMSIPGRRAFSLGCITAICMLFWPICFSWATKLPKSYHAFCGKGQFGIFDESGEVLISPQYDRADTALEYGVIRVKRQGKVGAVDLHGRELLPLAYEMISPSTGGLRPASIGGNYFYLNRDGKPAFDLASLASADFRFGYAVLMLKDDRQVLVDHNGKSLFEGSTQWGRIWIASPRLAIYMNARETDFVSGWIDLVSRKVYPSYPGILDLENGVLVIENGNDPERRTAHVLDRTNRKTRTIEGYVAITRDHKILVQKGAEFRLLDLMASEIADPRHVSSMEGQKHPAYVFRHKRKQGLVDEQGKIILPPVYDDISAIWSNGTTTIRKDNREGLVDDLGRVIIPPAYDEVEWMKDGRIPALSAGRWGFLDEKGKTVIPFEYEGVHGFDDGIAEIKKDGRWRKIDTQGRVFLPLEYAQDYAWIEGHLISVPKEAGGCPDYFDRHGDAVFKSIVDPDGTERFVDMSRNRTIWPSFR